MLAAGGGAAAVTRVVAAFGTHRRPCCQGKWRGARTRVFVVSCRHAVATLVWGGLTEGADVFLQVFTMALLMGVQDDIIDFLCVWGGGGGGEARQGRRLPIGVGLPEGHRATGGGGGRHLWRGRKGKGRRRV